MAPIVVFHQAQIVDYLNASGVKGGLLFNFGIPKLEFRRYTREKTDTDERDKRDG